MTTRIEDERHAWGDDDESVTVAVECDYKPIEVAIGETMARRIFCDHRTPERDIEAARHIARAVKAYRDEMAAE